MLFDLFSGNKDSIISILLSIPVIIFALSFHEVSHGYIAYKMGDPTARNLGRLTLNPLKHLDLLGTLSMLVFGFGWAKPVPINTRNFKNSRVGMALTGIAGPISNFILGVISCILFSISNTAYFYVLLNQKSESIVSVIYTVTLLFYISAILNFGLMAFNLIPIPPFDGSRFFYLFLPKKWYFKVMQHEQTIMIAVLIGFFALSYFGYSPISYIARGLFELIAEPFLNISQKIVFGV